MCRVRLFPHREATTSFSTRQTGLVALVSHCSTVSLSSSSVRSLVTHGSEPRDSGGTSLSTAGSLTLALVPCRVSKNGTRRTHDWTGGGLPEAASEDASVLGPRQGAGNACSSQDVNEPSVLVEVGPRYLPR